MQNGGGSKINYQGARGRSKREQGAKRYEKGSVKIGKKERAPKKRRELGVRSKLVKGAGSTIPLTKPL